ncbi:MAG: aminotransferase class III-fold pyridoxal phosphate-dependent enzyme, partial [candidate division KSB1 bacterium]|nr:aminotransferase class III-fold pyridoxal phosphate-dependent enzyme [candidate division KSB1 bacterium]
MNYISLEDAHTSGVYPKRPVVITRGQGAKLWDDTGREFIDCVGGYGMAIVGHANPYVINAVKIQMEKLMICPEIFYNDTRAKLLEKLSQIVPQGLQRFFLCNSGAEAVEAAIKFSRLATGKKEIICTMRGFHGRTYGALSATWDEKYRRGLDPFVPGFIHVPFNKIEPIREAVTPETAAVLVEIVQGEGGIHPGDRDYFQQLQELCQNSGVLLIIDEIQTGFGRTGRLFACQHYGLQPDILCLAKAIAGGIPMGVTALGARVGDLPKLSHGSTFGGNPVACAAALATIQYIEDYELVTRAQRLGEYLKEKLQAIPSKIIREVRGLGLMIGIELKEKVTPYLQQLLERRVLA